MPVEVPPHVQKILGPYPELIEQWKAQMALRCMQEPGWSGTLKRYLDSVYLRRVASEHCRLIEGNIERPGPEFAAAIEAALQLHTGMARQRSSTSAIHGGEQTRMSGTGSPSTTTPSSSAGLLIGASPATTPSPPSRFTRESCLKTSSQVAHTR